MNDEMKKAVELVKTHEYSIASLQDLQFIAKTIPHSAINLIDPQSVSRIKQLIKKVEDLAQKEPLTSSHYLFLMLVANSLIHDDHTNVFINEIKDQTARALMYARFLASF
jgi:hypothetical protein